MATERNYLFDNIKAFLIFSTVFAHFLKKTPGFDADTAAGYTYILIFSFIMQGFFLISGFFSQNPDKCRWTAVRNFLLPYVVFVYLTSFMLVTARGGPSGTVVDPTFALWFLLAMFVYKVLLKTLDRIPYILPLSFCLYLVSGAVTVLDETWASARLCNFLVFFIAGYKMKREHFEKIRQIDRKYVCVILVALVTISICIGHFGLFDEGMLYLKRPFSYYHMSFIEGVLCRLLIAVVFSGWMLVFVNLMPEKKIAISDIGRKTVTVYLLHIGVRYIFAYMDIIGDGGVESYLISLAAALLCTWAFSRDFVFKGYNRIMDILYKPIDFVYQGIKKSIVKMKV